MDKVFEVGDFIRGPLLTKEDGTPNLIAIIALVRFSGNLIWRICWRLLLSTMTVIGSMPC